MCHLMVVDMRYATKVRSPAVELEILRVAMTLFLIPSGNHDGADFPVESLIEAARYGNTQLELYLRHDPRSRIWCNM